MSIESLTVSANENLLREIRDARTAILRDLDAAENAVREAQGIASSASGRPFVVSTLLDSAAELGARISERTTYYRAAAQS